MTHQAVLALLPFLQLSRDGVPTLMARLFFPPVKPGPEERDLGNEGGCGQRFFFVQDSKDFFFSSERRKVPSRLGRLRDWSFSPVALGEHHKQPLEQAPDAPDRRTVGTVGQRGA